MSNDYTQILQQQVAEAYARGQSLKIVGGDSKAFYGRQVAGEVLELGRHQGVLTYEPTELVITVRAGTLLTDIQDLLAAQGQMLGFEPPAFANSATIGGTIACNFSGPGRAAYGAARDFVLGCKIINGKGEVLSFGGEVMKNVAGYDVSRLMAGSLGTLGVLLEISLKVLPRPECEQTMVFECGEEEAIHKMTSWARQPLPITATCYFQGRLMLRLSGSEKGVQAAVQKLGGDSLAEDAEFWAGLKEQQLPFFKNQANLWRLSVAQNTHSLSRFGETLYEWNGALRWLANDDVDAMFAVAAEVGGHATLFRGEQPEGERFQPLSPGLLRIHRNLKQAFDPKNILNPGKMYSTL